MNRIESGELDLQPNFQRGEIWDIKRKQRLIDTVLRGWYVPAVHIVVDSDENDLVLDGQQRFATLRSFFADDFPVNGNVDPISEDIQELDGLRYTQLPAPVRRRINRFVIPIVTLRDYEPEEPNELFFRLNQSYNLTPPEKRNALHSAARDQVRHLVNQLGTIGLLQHETVGFNNRRLAYDDIIARSCVALEQNSIGTHINNAVVEKYYRGGEFSTSTLDSIRDSGARLFRMVQGSGKVRFNKGTLQTWLLYCDWAYEWSDYSALPRDLLHRFESERNLLRQGNFGAGDPALSSLRTAIRLYDDRASYRVTDVSSVLTRDLALHLFSMKLYGTSPRKNSDALLAALAEAPEERQQAIFFDFVQSSDWGVPLKGTI
ncbi:DUF262 domain-containing protein [Gordonia sp. SL306]|uniref:DUF262 domain-containing protein n=1 Tax=Gordonia sp. SL306 TaxID=2995145 RepID=UPI0022702E6B|nr:DUF262 domain-containing protein [Gordonia sp. SL306]WAC57552.1 DUF262 domain-containing protein [Gordonia sp. SL306]